jgi:hypothetical protein
MEALVRGHANAKFFPYIVMGVFSPAGHAALGAASQVSEALVGP